MLRFVSAIKRMEGSPFHPTLDCLADIYTLHISIKSSCFYRKYLLIKKEHKMRNVKTILSDASLFLLIPILMLIEFKYISFFSAVEIKFIIIGLAVFKLLFYIIFTFELIARLNKKVFNLRLYLLLMLLTLIILQLNFALDYTLLWSIDKGSFSNINLSNSFFVVFLNMIYYSVVIFSTVGFGDIVPISLASRGLVTVEILTSMIFLIGIITNYNNIKEELKR